MDLLWLMTVDFKCAIIAYDILKHELRTLWNDNLGRFYEAYSEHSQTSKVDGTSTYIGLSLTDILKVLKLNYDMLTFTPGVGYDGSISAHLYSLPMEVRNTVDYDFLDTDVSRANVAVLYSDSNLTRH